MSDEIKWTPEQWDAIHTTGCGLLVSAAAGSGKTAVLAERCIYLVCDAPEACDITELLVVTFTEAATAQMKQRIGKRLNQRMSQGGATEARLRRQQALVDQANISTLHGFCMRLIRQNFHRIGLDPALRVIDQEQATLLRNQTLRQMFVDHYETGDVDFAALIESYGDGRDEMLMELVLKAHQVMDSLVDAAAWRRQAIERIKQAAELPLAQSALGQQYLQSVEQKLSAIADAAQRTARQIPAEFSKYPVALNELAETVRQWRTTLQDRGYDALRQITSDYKKPRLPPYSDQISGKKQAYEAVDRPRKALDALIKESLVFSSDQWRDGLRAILPHAEAFLGLVDEFGQRYATEKRLLHALDFSDQEHLALKLLQMPEVAAECHRQFKQVLVDEYQDINAVQEAILLRASREGELFSPAACGGRGPDEGGRMKDEENAEIRMTKPEIRNGSTKLDAGKSEIQNPKSEIDSSFILHPSSFDCSNLFCVGDVKQSIYRFRLADPELFLDKARRFRQPGVDNIGRVIDLKKNFRSRGPLLEAINGVFEVLMTEASAEIEYDSTHRLVAGREFANAPEAGCFIGAPIELHVLETRPRQGNSENVGDDGGDSGDDDELDQLQREALFIARRIKQLMGLTGQPRMKVEGEDGGYRDIEYGDIVILLRTAAHQAEPIAQMLREQNVPVHSDRGGGFFESLEIQDMISLLQLLDNQRQDIPLAAVLRSPLGELSAEAMATIRLAYKDVPFHRAVALYAEQRSDAIAGQLKKFVAQLLVWRDLAQRRPLAEVVWQILTETGYLAFCAGLRDGAQRQANLMELYRRCHQVGPVASSLYRFLLFMDELRKQQETAHPPLAAGDGQAVRIMTIHASKGLEFPVVFVPNLGKKPRAGDEVNRIIVDRSGFLGMMVSDNHRQIRYCSLAQVVAKEQMQRQSRAEALRVLYVAMTRAKEHVILSGSCELKHVESSRQWNDHRGPLPAEYFASCQNMLAWLLPAASILDGRQRRAIALTTHALGEADDSGDTYVSDPPLTPLRQSMIALKAIDAPAEPVAQGIITALEYQYPHSALSRLAAARSMTWLSHQGQPLPIAPETPERQIPAPLRLPRRLNPDAAPEAADVGIATHLVLQHLDFSAAATADQIIQQMKSMITRRLLSAEQQAWVDVESIAWFVGTEPGQLAQQQNRQILREMPIYLASDPAAMEAGIASADPADRVMLRGRIDAAVPTPDGLMLIDYKTDRLSPGHFDERAAHYARQLSLYRDTLQRLSGKPVWRCYLVFLALRRLWEC